VARRVRRRKRLRPSPWPTLLLAGRLLAWPVGQRQISPQRSLRNQKMQLRILHSVQDDRSKGSRRINFQGSQAWNGVPPATMKCNCGSFTSFRMTDPRESRRINFQGSQAWNGVPPATMKMQLRILHSVQDDRSKESRRVNFRGSQAWNEFRPATMKMQLRILHFVQDDRSKGIAKDQFSPQSGMERVPARNLENATVDPSLCSG
jgi:hypothetical protein